MLVGVFSDVHANLPAFEAVLDDMPAVDALVCAGDVVGYNPWPAECVEAVRSRDVPTVMGNHDRMVVSDRNFRGNGMAAAGVDYAREHLDADARAWLSALPPSIERFDGRVRVVHGHPDDPDHYTYPDEFGPELLGEEELLVLGHTHHQHHEVYDEGIVCNPGSVGQPRDGNYRAAYAVVDLDERSVDEHRVGYDTGTVIDAVADADLPREIGFRLTQGR